MEPTPPETREYARWHGEPRVRFLLNLPRPLYRALQDFAATHNQTMTLVLVTALQAHLDAQAAKPE